MPATDSLSLVFSALADPTRRAILSTLAHGPATVGEVAAPFPMSAPAISQHLKVLERAGLVARTTQAQWRTLSMQAEPLDEATGWGGSARCIDEAATWVEQHRRHWNQRLDALDAHLQTMKTRPKNDEAQEAGS